MTWASVVSDLCGHMTSLSHNELKMEFQLPLKIGSKMGLCYCHGLFHLQVITRLVIDLWHIAIVAFLGYALKWKCHHCNRICLIGCIKTSKAASDNNFIKMTFLFQCLCHHPASREGQMVLNGIYDICTTICIKGYINFIYNIDCKFKSKFRPLKFWF